MTSHTAFRVWVVVSLMALLIGGASADPTEYLQYDARISGDQINHFTDDGETVSVVTGNFMLTVGDRSITAQRGVVWIKSDPAGRQSLKNDVVVYVEGDAQVHDRTSSTSDRMMLIKLYIQGRISASGGSVSTRPLHDLPLYQRAVKVRGEEARMQQEYNRRAAQLGKTPQPQGPMVIRESAPPQPAERPTPDRSTATQPDAAREPAGQGGMALEALGMTTPASGETVSATLSEDAPAVSTQPAPPPQQPTPTQSAVHFQAPEGVKIEKDPETPEKRISIAKGKVYLSQGPRDSDEYIELRADSAVVFSQVMPERETIEQVPYAPPIIGLSGGGEKVTGIYLEGDVIISRGERKMTGQAAFYDFVQERAIILEPVMRTIQEQRNIPIYIRADKARVLSPREIKFYNAIVSTSDFKTPTYAMGAKEAIFRDETPYDAEGNKLGENRYSTEFKHATWDIRGVPIAYVPGGKTEFEEGHTALRTMKAGRMGKLGWGAESEWHLFRLLGLAEPEGLDTILTASGYEKGAVLGVDGDYQRREENRQYSGYFKLFGVYDRKAEDTFGDDRRDIQAPHRRGRVLARHKEYLPRDWQIQAELSLICDRNFLEEFFPDEYWTGKDQENLIYAKKQRDNWAITALLKARLNDFLTQSESYPEAAAYLIGEPLADNRLTYFGEIRGGAMRYREDDQDPYAVRSPGMGRFDTRHEVDLPLAVTTPWGPLNVVPYAAGRMTYWTDTPTHNEQVLMYGNPLNSQLYDNPDTGGGGQFRAYAQGGVRANMTFWRLYNNVESRLWDVHRLKHIATPEVVAFGSAAGNVYPDQLYPVSPDVEESIRQNTGVQVALRQRLQTLRGPAGDRRVVDWMRFNITYGWFQNQDPTLPGDGRTFMSRPEYSLQRHYVNAEYAWNISDSIALLADMNWDLGDGDCERVNIGVAVTRSPRLSYYAGFRYINDYDSAIGTVGATYRINKKYTISAYEQFDFRYRDGVNLGSRVSIIRKFPRWYAGITFTFDQRYDGDDEYGIMLALWPEGVPEFGIGGGAGKFGLQNRSGEN